MRLLLALTTVTISVLESVDRCALHIPGTDTNKVLVPVYCLFFPMPRTQSLINYQYLEQEQSIDSDYTLSIPSHQCTRGLLSCLDACSHTLNLKGGDAMLSWKVLLSASVNLGFQRRR